MQFYEIIEFMSFYDFRSDGSFESWINKRRDNMMSSTIISLIDNNAKIVSEINIKRLSDIEIMLCMFRIIRIEWFENIDKILFGFYNDFFVVVGNIDIIIKF